ncbi:MAG: sensor domain-containing diguanylate cyclase [Christensenellaceae bacterium]|jgi:diguanylate cyclase (GGDEF)-like protein/PAS domain S-box-containing protein|nr:sensor domain-containing diguanylate cyclase [Christensenellaceae bacterium]
MGAEEQASTFQKKDDVINGVVASEAIINTAMHQCIQSQILSNVRCVVLRLACIDDDWTVVYISDNIAYFGYSSNEILEKTVKWHEIIHPEDLGGICITARDHEQNREDDYGIRFRVRHANGYYVSVNARTSIVRDISGVIEFYDMTLSENIETSDSTAMINSEMLDAINEILIASVERDTKKALDLILNNTGDYLGIKRISVLVIESLEKNNVVLQRHWKDDDESSGTESIINFFSSADGSVLLNEISKNKLYVIDRETNSNIAKAFLECIASKSLAICDLKTGNNLHEVMIFDARRHHKIWSTSDIKFCEMVVHFLSEIFAQSRNEETISRTGKIMETILNNIPSYLYVADPIDNSIVFANNAYIKDFVDTDGGPVGHNSLRDAIATELKAARSRNSSQFFEIELTEFSKRLGVYQNYITWIDGTQKQLFSCVDLSEKWRHDKFIKRIAYSDYLTGLGNRYNFDLIITDCITNAISTNRSGYVIFIDLDDFKLVNDNHGHDYGDALLVAFAEFLNTTIKENSSNCAFRFGGDEFVALIPLATPAQLRGIIEKLMKRVETPWRILSKSIVCTLSIGIVEFPKHGRSSKEIIKRADIAMYKAKIAGKNKYRIFNNKVQARSELV